MSEDQSPKIYPATVRKELSQAAQKNLTELTYRLQILSQELSSVCAMVERPEVERLPARGFYMAIAFEAGRRCGVQQAIGVAPKVKDVLLELIER